MFSVVFGDCGSPNYQFHRSFQHFCHPPKKHNHYISKMAAVRKLTLKKKDMGLELPTPVFLWRSTKWLMVQSQHLCFWAGSCACHKGLACHGCSRFGFVVRVWQYPLRAIYFDEELADSLKWNLKMQTVTCEIIPWVLFCPSNSGKWWLIWRLMTKKIPNTQQWKTSI